MGGEGRACPALRGGGSAGLAGSGWVSGRRARSGVRGGGTVQYPLGVWRMALGWRSRLTPRAPAAAPPLGAFVGLPHKPTSYSQQPPLVSPGASSEPLFCNLRNLEDEVFFLGEL